MFISAENNFALFTSPPFFFSFLLFTMDCIRFELGHLRNGCEEHEELFEKTIFYKDNDAFRPLGASSGYWLH